MAYHPITSFRRAVDAALIEHIHQREAPLPETAVNKWDALRNLGVARTALGVSDRALSVLQALLSFHPETELASDNGALIVFPSNASICERLNGMPCSTMRRHIAQLVDTGLISRCDSPNGKRFARRSPLGTQAYGFDLSPLIRRHSEIAALADRMRLQTERHKRLREKVSLLRRDLAGLVAYGSDEIPGLALWDQLGDLSALSARALRRKLNLDELQKLGSELEDALARAKAEFTMETDELSTKDADIEQHHQSSNKKQEKETGDADTNPISEERSQDPNLPLAMVLSVCSEVQTYAPERIKTWNSLLRAVEAVRPMMGITRHAWEEAVTHMGRFQAATVVAAILERFTEIRSPGGYLRALTRKAEEGAFSISPMIMALRQRRAA